MDVRKHEKTALFIDGANLYATARVLQIEIDFKQLREFFRSRCNLLRANYYTILLEDQEFSSIRPLIDWLDYNGYNVVTKPGRQYEASDGRLRTRQSIHVDLAMDVVDTASYIDHAVLFTGDSNYLALVRSLQEMGKRVSIVSTLDGSPPVVADDLRRQADQFVDLADLESYISRGNSRPDGRGRQARCSNDDCVS